MNEIENKSKKIDLEFKNVIEDKKKVILSDNKNDIVIKLDNKFKNNLDIKELIAFNMFKIISIYFYAAITNTKETKINKRFILYFLNNYHFFYLNDTILNNNIINKYRQLYSMNDIYAVIIATYMKILDLYISPLTAIKENIISLNDLYTQIIINKYTLLNLNGIYDKSNKIDKLFIESLPKNKYKSILITSEKLLNFDNDYCIQAIESYLTKVLKTDNYNIL